MKSLVMRGSNYLVDFLKVSDIEQFRLITIAAEVRQGPTTLSGFHTLTGSINTKSTKEAQDFCNSYGTFIKNF